MHAMFIARIHTYTHEHIHIWCVLNNAMEIRLDMNTHHAIAV